MSINDRDVTKEAKELALQAWEESEKDAERASELLWEMVDGHQWVIYYHHARQLCCNCDITEGQDFVEEMDMPTCDFDTLATRIAFGELYRRGQLELLQLEEDHAQDAA